MTLPFLLAGAQVIFDRFHVQRLGSDAVDEVRQPKRATEALTAWLSWASCSKLKPFLKASRTIRKHLDGVLAYVKGRLTNGFAEGSTTSSAW